MNRIDAKFEHLKHQGRKILCPYLTAGDPSLASTLKLMHRLVENGADMLELGIPFSDPMAEGPVIQAAMERALQQQVSCKDVLQVVRKFREKDAVTPVILMGYLNPIEVYGYESFARDAKEAGVDGTLIVDLPPEESQAPSQYWKANDLQSIYLCSPTTSDTRMADINRYATSWLYFVSLKGVSGSDAIDLDVVKALYALRKKLTTLPVLVGFGIKTPEMAAQIGQFADGIVVGAALIEKIYQAAGETSFEVAGDFIHQLRKALDDGLYPYE